MHVVVALERFAGGAVGWRIDSIDEKDGWHVRCPLALRVV
jgi:hypothetical protein